VFWESPLDNALSTLKKNVSAPVRVVLWDGREVSLSDKPRVTVRLKGLRAAAAFMRPSLLTLAEAYIDGHADLEGDLGEAIRSAEAIHPRDAAAAIPVARPHRRPPHEERRSRGGAASLRRLQRFLRPVARSPHGVFVRLFPRRRRFPRSGAAAEARPHLHEAAPRARRDLPRHRLRLGCAGAACRRALRGEGDGNHALREPASARQRAHPAPRAWRIAAR